MEVITHGGLRLWVIRFGELDKMSSKILYEDANGKRITITYSDIKEQPGCYSMPPRQK